MSEARPSRQYRFGIFEADAATGELRRQGVRVKLNAQPSQVLAMLLERPGDLLTREEIARELWPDGTFVDYEHGVNSAVNRIREALRDSAASPRFIKTLARRGYRFVAPVERISPAIEAAAPLSEPTVPEDESPAAPVAETAAGSWLFASPQDLPKASPPVVQTLFVLLQIMYLSFYIGALANLAEIEDLISPLLRAGTVLTVLVVSAAVLIPVRLFLLSAALFHAPGMQQKFRRLWPFVLPLDVLWALSPFLLLHHIPYGLALSCTSILVYSPFAQRSLVLMGAGSAQPEASAATR